MPESPLYRWLHPPVPTHLQDNAVDRRLYLTALATFPLGALVHGAFIVLFWWLGSEVMAWFNVGATCFYAFSSHCYRRTGARWLLTLTVPEIVAHAVIASYAIGWASGFHLYLLPLAASWGMISGRASRWGSILLAAAAWVLTLWATSDHVPWSQVDAQVVRVIATFNFGCAFILIWLIAASANRVATRAEEKLQVEHERSERLLRNILPGSIADRLKDSTDVIADGFDEASVLFSDIVGFTPLSERVTPQELVSTLNDIFSRIDELVDQYELEKIKTIGDAYMVAGGLPEPRPDHLERLADFALDMTRVLGGLRAATGATLDMRIGMHAGPVVAGVIGRRKFAYDLWGDTVNTAARMESHGLPGRVHVTAYVRDQLAAQFTFERREPIQVKGKGEMQTYLLVGRRA